MRKNFFEDEKYKTKLEGMYLNSQRNLHVLFDWFDLPEHHWANGSQQNFFECVQEILQENDPLSQKLTKAAICKRYQRYRQLTPEQHLKQKAQTRKALERLENMCGDFDYPSFQHPLSIVQDKVEQIWRERVKPFDQIFGVKSKYCLCREDISAQGIWINYEAARIILEFWSIDYPKLPFDILLMKKGEGVFLVFAGAQMKKNAKLGEKHKHIAQKRQELIDSDLVKDGEDLFILKDSVAFSSPSLAASVLTGLNINGQIYWKDYRGRTFRELHPKFEKIKRGPGRPKKSS